MAISEKNELYSSTGPGQPVFCGVVDWKAYEAQYLPAFGFYLASILRKIRRL